MLNGTRLFCSPVATRSGGPAAHGHRASFPGCSEQSGEPGVYQHQMIGGHGDAGWIVNGGGKLGHWGGGIQDRGRSTGIGVGIIGTLRSQGHNLMGELWN